MPDLEVLTEQLTEVLTRLAREIEPQMPPGFTFALFVYEEREGGHVSQISRDRDRTFRAVGQWILSRRDAEQPKGSA